MKTSKQKIRYKFLVHEVITKRTAGMTGVFVFSVMHKELYGIARPSVCRPSLRLSRMGRSKTAEVRILNFHCIVAPSL